MTGDELTEQQIETLAFNWPWEYERTAAALRLAEREGWALDDTVAGLDTLAEDFGDDADPEAVVQAAIYFKRRQRERRQQR